MEISLARHATARQYGEGAMNLDQQRLVSQKNIDEYKRLASGILTEAERTNILRLLAEEEAKYRVLWRPRHDNY